MAILSGARASLQDDVMDQAFGRSNPNPDRLGCPSQAVLIALASRQRSADDPCYEHLINCSPCYLAVRELQETQRRQRQRQRFVMLARSAAVAVVLLAAAVGWVFVRGSSAVQRPNARELHSELDLRPYTLTRGAPSADRQLPLLLPRARTRLTIFLPTGSEPGRYDVQVVNVRGVSEASTAGEASMQNQVTTLQTMLDLRGLTSGAYELKIRRIGQAWQQFPARVE